MNIIYQKSTKSGKNGDQKIGDQNKDNTMKFQNHEELSQLYKQKKFQEIISSYLADDIADELRTDLDTLQIIAFSAFYISNFSLALQVSNKIKALLPIDEDEEIASLKKTLDRLAIDCKLKLNRKAEALILMKRYIEKHGKDKMLLNMIPELEHKLTSKIYIGLSIFAVLFAFSFTYIQPITEKPSYFDFLLLVVMMLAIGFMLFFPKRCKYFIVKFFLS